MDKTIWINEFQDKKILIHGFGAEGKSSYRFLRTLFPNAPLFISDQEKNAEQILSQVENVTFIKEEDIAKEGFDLILKSPGIVPSDDIPKEIISGQTQLFLKHYGKQVVGVTGTKGKSTTTSLIAEVLKQRYKTHLVGNIGIPCFDCIYDLEEEDLVAFEISCHQLEYALYSPHIAVYLNLFEEHLDHYGSFEAYGRAKDQIFLHQSDDDILFVGKDIKDRVTTNQTTYILGEDCYAENEVMHFKEASIHVEESSLLGNHNKQYMALAYAIGQLFGIRDEDYLKAMKEFKPLPHRLEYVGSYNGVGFVDDSISTIGNACIQALKALPKTDCVLVGGMDRGIDYTELETYLKTRDDLQIIFMYATGKRIYEELKEERPNFHVVENLEEAVKLGTELTREGHYCLLSPAASSYDHFKNFEERGDIFRKLALHE